MHRTKRESSSELAPIMKAKSIDDLLEGMYTSPEGSEEALETLDEIIRRAALYSELKAKNEQLEALLRSPTSRVVMLAPESNKAQ